MNKFPDIKHHLKRIIAINAVSLMLIAPAHAAYNGAVLSEIKINPYYDKSFQIVLKTGQNIPVDKHIVSDEEIVLELRDVKAAKFVNTIYNNTSGIDHVIVQPLSGNRVRLLMQGSNIAASRVVIDSNKSASNSTQSRPSANIAAQTKPNAESIQQEQTVDPETNVNNNINQQTEKAVQEIQDAEIADVAETQETTTAQAEEQPVALYRQPSNTFKPAVSLEEDFEEEPENASSLSKIQQAMSGGMFANLFSAKTLDWLLRIAFLAVIIAALYKMFNPKNKNVKIDLNPNSRAREVDLLKTLNDRRSSIGTGLRDYPTSLPKKPGYSSISNYGLKEYQTSQMPPKNLGIKNSMSSIKRETKYIKPPTNPSLMNRNEKIDPLSRSSTKTLNPALNQSKITQKEIDNAKVNIDSQRFLETMAKIYEKSGRVDLAKGIEKKILHK